MLPRMKFLLNRMPYNVCILCYTVFYRITHAVTLFQTYGALSIPAQQTLL